jgi:hypothetical protein
MEKVVLKKEDVEGILTMYKSKDKDNHVVAYEILNNCDIEMSKDWIALIYAASNITNSIWDEYAPEILKLVTDMKLDSLYKVPVGKAINTFITIGAKPEVIDYYLELHVADLKNTMKTWGYPIEKLNFTLTMKND